MLVLRKEGTLKTVNEDIELTRTNLEKLIALEEGRGLKGGYFTALGVWLNNMFGHGTLAENIAKTKEQLRKLLEQRGKLLTPDKPTDTGDTTGGGGGGEKLENALAGYQDFLDKKLEIDRELAKIRQNTADKEAEALAKSGEAWRKYHEARSGTATGEEKYQEIEALRNAMMPDTSSWWEKQTDDFKKYMAEWSASAEGFGETMARVSQAAAEKFSSGMTDALMEWIEGTKSAKDAFREFAVQFLREMAKMIIQQAILNALKSGFGAYFGAAEGGVFSGHLTPVASFAEGGIVKQPTMALIGEGGGPEAVIPLKNGAVPVQLKSSGEQGITIVNNVTIEYTGKEDQKDAEIFGREINRQLKEQIKQTVRDEMRPGGDFNRQVMR
jgi:phage-related minor tail protein